MQFRLSVAIPTYNREQTLSECLASVLCSDMDDLEVLVSDNCSTDGTRDVLSNIKDHRLHWWSNGSNLGANANINCLLSKAAGEYVLMLTDDSMLSKDAILELLAILDSYPTIGLVMSRMAYMNTKTGEVVGFKQELEQQEYFAPGNSGLESLWLGTHVLPRLVIRRDLIDMEGAAKYVACGYQHSYMAGRAIKEGGAYYSNKVLVINLCGKNYWKYPHDFWMPDQVAILRDLLPDSEELVTLQNILRRMLRADIVHMMNISGGRAIFKLPRIPEVRKEPVFWVLTLGWLALLPYRLLKRSFAQMVRSILPRDQRGCDRNEGSASQYK